jgi:acyl-CoA hydrolase/GNAT superfamily N-acetyltransferase
MHWQERYRQTAHTLDSAVALIRPGQHLFLGSGAAVPSGLVAALVARPQRFANNPIGHIMTLGEAPYVAPGLADHFRHNAYFIGPNTRDAVQDGRADYTPVFLSQIPELMRRRRLPVDVALIQTSPPDEHGFVNLGVSVDVVLAAVEAAELVIAEINPKMPVLRGDGYLRMDDLDAWVLHESELPCLPPRVLDEAAREIGRHVASLVDDGATIQTGIGVIPDATLGALSSKKDLGVWTEMLSDGIVDLVQAGVITGKWKTTDPGRVSASFAFGSQRIYSFLHEHPGFVFHPSDVINDPALIARQHKMVAINTALEVDLTGQVCSDSLGERFYSGIGGQVDFIRGASMSSCGRPIIALRSTAKSGQISRIVAQLSAGAGVVTSRGDVHYVVTEYGIADLHGRSVRERVLALISVAHPDFRAELMQAAKGMRYVFQDQSYPSRAPSYEGSHAWSDSDLGDLRIRPARETDEQKMSDFFYALSEDTVRKRWQRVVPAMPHPAIQRYLHADGDKHVALVAETVPQGDRESELLGVGSYHVGDDHWAEMAVVVRDDRQGHGIGERLLDQLRELAMASRIRGFRFETTRTNTRLARLVERLGLKVQVRDDGESLIIEAQLDPAGEPRPH